jgi:transposase
MPPGCWRPPADPTLAPSNGGGVQVVTLGEIVLIHDLKRQGLSVSAIARKVGLDRKTVRRHLERGMEPPVYGPRAPRPRQLAPYEAYLRERIAAWPDLTGKRLLREIRELGYGGCYSVLTDFLREARPPRPKPFERRFETAPGRQGQVDFAQFKAAFTDEPGVERPLALHHGSRPQPLALGPVLRHPPAEPSRRAADL